MSKVPDFQTIPESYISFVKNTENVFVEGGESDGYEGNILECCNNVDVDVNDIVEGHTMLSIACERGLYKHVEILLENEYIDVNLKNPLEKAIEKNSNKCLDLLLKREDLNVNVKDHQDNSILIKCLSYWKNEYAFEQLLIERKDIDVNLQNRYEKDTPLIYACSNQMEKQTELLLQIDDIDVNKYDNIKYTPLLWSIYRKNENLVKLLLDNPNIDIYHQTGNGDGKNAMDFALNSTDEIRKLVQDKINSLNEITKP
eukprot:TRINITY_DN5152_c0_g1_i1.p1 TRINITY_DN5152_c0_g1~~TRINITY_DN5152_c0_g1_i1.p1  ORF type:complete len:257 (-),score=66.25 TRINITY_DN5152_c0_g1_i1:119-889(-)